MADINPITAAAHYDYQQGTCNAEPVNIPAQKSPTSNLSNLSFFASLAPAAAPTGSNLLGRNVWGTSPLTQGNIKFNALTTGVATELTRPGNIALAFAAPGLLAKGRQFGTLAELSLFSGREAIYVTRPVAASLALGLAACGAPEGGDYTSADAGTPPPNSDVDCDNLYDSINSTPSDQSFQALVNSLNLTSMNMDVKLYDNKVLVDAKGNLIGTLKPSEVVAWQKKGNVLFILTRTKAETNQDGPVALFAYRLNANNTLASSNPIPTAFPGGKAVILPPTDPINMSGIEYNGGDWLGITFGADSSNIVYLIDPAVPANVNANQPYNPRIRPDECAIKDSSGADAGSPDASGN